MKNLNISSRLKELGAAFLDTYKRKPLKSAVVIALIVASLAISILMGVLLGPVVPVAVAITLSSICLMNPTMLTFLHFQDIKESLFNQFKKNHTIDKVSNSDVVLVLEAKDDHNDAFQQDQRDIFEKVEKKYALVYEKVSSIDDVGESINQVLMRNNRIQAIWFRAHGNPQGMHLDKNQSLDLENIVQLKFHLEQINPQGTIILDSCSTAGENRTGDVNIAKKIAQLLPGRTIIASSRDTSNFSIKVDKANPLKVKMWTEHEPSKHRFLKYPSMALNVFKELLFNLTNGKGVFKKLAFNATKVYHYPKPA